MPSRLVAPLARLGFRVLSGCLECRILLERAITSKLASLQRRAQHRVAENDSFAVYRI